MLPLDEATDGTPGPAVWAAFGAAGHEPARMPGGRGLTWRAGPVVLRPSDEPVESAWKAGVLAALDGDGFRVPARIRTLSGAWTVGGWECWQWLPGAADETRLEDVVRVGRAFHAALVGVARPPFIAAADSAWSRADRMAWYEETVPRDDVLDRLVAAFGPVDAPSQLVHGDLLGNVLFAPDEPPTVIDWAPYWRPTEYGSAIAAVDAVCWHGVALGRMWSVGRRVPDWRQLLVRALVFRIATLHLLGAWDTTTADRHRALVAALTS